VSLKNHCHLLNFFYLAQQFKDVLKAVRPFLSKIINNFDARCILLPGAGALIVYSSLRQYTRSLVSVTAVSLKLLYFLCLAPSCPMIQIFSVFGTLLSGYPTVFWCLALSCPLIKILSAFGSILSNDRNIFCVRLRLVQRSEYFLC